MTELSGWDHLYSGKDRDLYTSPDHPNLVLMVASDRVSAFDHVLEPAIPGKGALLTQLSRWWFDQLDSVPSHLAPEADWAAIPAEVADRSMLVTRLEMFPIECVVRGYLSGSGWVEYQQTQSVCGVELPTGLQDGDRLPQAIFTPAWKAPLGQHDENITIERAAELVGLVNASALRDLSIAIFERASAIAETKGILLADTKFEFGSTVAARSRWPTRCSHRTAAATGMPRCTRAAIVPPASTSRSCATGSRPTGRGKANRRHCPRMSSYRLPRDIRSWSIASPGDHPGVRLE